jgi:hypothetical protein
MTCRFKNKVNKSVNCPAKANIYNRALGLKIDNIKPTPLISIIGPNTKNANKEPLVKVEAKDKAKKESTVEQIDTTAAKINMARIEVIGPAPKLRINSRGAKT